jgi:tRNA wybutosine-synthesizing protein 1
MFGVGSRAYGDSFNAVARDLAKQMKALGATEVVPLCEGDVDGDDVDAVFDRWCKKVVRFLKGGELENGDAVAEECGVSSSEEDSDVESEVETEIVDLEDIAGKAPSRKSVTTSAQSNGKLNGPREMVTPVIKANLVKQVLCSSSMACIA